MWSWHRIAVVLATFLLDALMKGDMVMNKDEDDEKGATEPTGGNEDASGTNTPADAGGGNSETEQVLDTKSINSRLDGIEDMIHRLTGSLQKVTDAQSVLLQSGAVIDTNDTDPSDDDGVKAFNDPSFDTLDLRITD